MPFMITFETILAMNTILTNRVSDIRPEALNSSERLALRPSTDLTLLLEHIYHNQRQTKRVYELKVELRQKIFNLLSKTLEERIDLYLIGSSLTGLATNSSDTDLCLIIYDSDNKIDAKYENKQMVISKLEQLRQILMTNGIAEHPELIPALVPIIKFIDKSTGIEVNVNVNQTVTIRNSHLLHLYSQMDSRVQPLILTIKLWAQKKGINCAFNKSLSSYSISLMAIYYLQSVCNPPVVPALLKDFPHVFNEDVTRLRLDDFRDIDFRSHNTEELGQLFINFLEYFCIIFPYNKVISLRTNGLIERSQLMARPESNGRQCQWKCHLCIEEPFDGSNTSHAVHNIFMFRQIVHSLTETYFRLKSQNLNNFI